MSSCNNCNGNSNQNCAGNNIYVSGSPTLQAINVSNNRARYYAELAESYKNETQELLESTRYYAEQNADVTKEYVDDLGVALQNLISAKQDSGNYALVSQIPVQASDISAADTTLSNVSSINNGSAVKTALDGKVDTALSNLTSTGEKHFLNKYQIANCILENPATVNISISEGTVTVKAGSVVVFPMGTTNQSSTYTKGSDFGTGYTVYDTAWDSTNSRFFVLAQLKADISGTQTSSAQCDLFLTSTGSTSMFGSTASTSGTSPAANKTYYDTSANTLARYNSSVVAGNPLCFPIAKIGFENSSPATIVQSYSGIGYIGSVVWASKGIKVLRPNGFNSDGTLKNVEYTTPNVLIYDVTGISTSIRNLYITTSGTLGSTTSFVYLANDNYNSSIASVPVGYVSVNSGVVDGLSYNTALNLNTLTDGQWLGINTQLASGVSLPTSTALSYSLASVLPNDNYAYEVLLTGAVTTGTTLGNESILACYTDIISSFADLCWVKTRSASYSNAAGSVILPVGIARTIYVNPNASNTGTFSLWVKGYRRLGVNI